MIWLDLEPFSYRAPHSLVQSPNASSCIHRLAGEAASAGLSEPQHSIMLSFLT